jgi:hypothetical protein
MAEVHQKVLILNDVLIPNRNWFQHRLIIKFVKLSTALICIEKIIGKYYTSLSVFYESSLINKYWCFKKSQLDISSLKSVMLVYTNFHETCHEMFNMLKTDQKLLKEIHKSQK